MNLPPTVVVLAAGLMACSSKSAQSSCASPAPRGSATAGGDEGPSLVIEAKHPGSDPSEMATSVTQPLEEAVASCNGIAAIHSRSDSGRSNVAVWLESAAARDSVTECVHQKVEQSNHVLPPDVLPPLLRRGEGPPVAIVTLRDPSRSDLELGADATRLAHALDAVPGVTRTRVCGPTPVLVVRLDPLKLRQHRLLLDEVLRTLARSAEPSGASIERLAKVELASQGGVRLQDVATLSLEGEPESCRAASLSSGSLVAIEVHGARAAADGLTSALDAMRRELPGSDALAIELASDSGRVEAVQLDDQADAVSRDHHGLQGSLLFSPDRGVRNLTAWIARPKEAAPTWLLDAAAELVPKPAWRVSAISAPGRDASATRAWFALRAANLEVCSDPAKSLSDALAPLAVSGSIHRFGDGRDVEARPASSIQIDRERAADLHVQIGDVAQTLRGAIAGIPIAGSTPSIVVRFTESDAQKLLALVDVPAGDRAVPLSSVVSFREQRPAGTLMRINRQDVLVVEALLKPSVEVPSATWAASTLATNACRIVAAGTGEP